MVAQACNLTTWEGKEDQKFKTSLGYMRPFLKEKKVSVRVAHAYNPRQRQKDYKFKVNLLDLVRPCLKKYVHLHFFFSKNL